MKTPGIRGEVSSKVFKRWKKIVDTQSVEKLTVFYVREFDETLDSIMRNKTKQILKKQEEDANRPFFTDKNGKAMRAVQNMQKANLEAER